MSKITNDGLTRSGTGCFYYCNHMATVGVKGLMVILIISIILKSDGYGQWTMEDKMFDLK